MYGKRYSIIQQPPNPTLFSGPIECRIREVSLYVCTYVQYVFVHSAKLIFCVTYALVLYSVRHNSSCSHEQLEEKTQTELQTLKEKIAKMTEEIGVYSDIQGLEKQEEERREVQPACTKDVAIVNTSHQLFPTCMYTYIHMYVCMCSQSILYTPCVCMYICAHSLYVHSVQTYVCMFAHVPIYVHTYVHTHAVLMWRITGDVCSTV